MARVCGLVLLLGLAGCSQRDQEHAREQAAEAQRKAEVGADKATAEAKRLGRDAKEQVGQLNEKIGEAMNRKADGNPSASEKLDHAGQVLKAEGHEAGRKLDKASLIARAKTKLANDVGAASLTNVSVDVSGSVVTLTGTVPTEDQRKRAEQDVSQLDGVTQVVNRLGVKP